MIPGEQSPHMWQNLGITDLLSPQPVATMETASFGQFILVSVVVEPDAVVVPFALVTHITGAVLCLPGRSPSRPLANLHDVARRSQGLIQPPYRK
jgi:hypothetical protein